MTKTIEELDKIIATAQAEKERLLQGDNVIKQGDIVYHLDDEGDVDEMHYDISYKRCIFQGNISKSREWLEMIKRRREIETKLLKYADWDASLCLWLSGGNVFATQTGRGKTGIIPMSRESAERCLDEMNPDDLKFYLTWGRG